jgi:hypothetical protein
MTDYKLIVTDAALAAGIVFLTSVGIAGIPDTQAIISAGIAAGLLFLRDVQYYMPNPEPPAGPTPATKP